MKPALVPPAVALLLLLVLAEPAAAQSVNVTVADLPRDPVVVRSNATHSFTAHVTLAAKGFVCTASSVLHVNLTLTPLGGVERFDAAPLELNYSVPAGVYAGTGGYEAARPLNVTVGARGLLVQNATRELAVIATFPGGHVPGCDAAGPFPSAQGTGNLTATFVAGNRTASPVGADAGPGGASAGASGARPGGSLVPAPGAAAAVLAAVLGVALRRFR